MKLYKYLSYETFREHLDSHLCGEVHLSSWKDFNDPMEGFFSFFGNRDPRPVVDAVVGEKTVFRVCCFCKSYKKLLLWSYYNKHRGVCLEYDIDRNCLPANCTLDPISYSRLLPQLDATDSVETQAKRFLLTKLLPWKHECEVRLLGRNLPQNTIAFGSLIGIIFGANYEAADNNDQLRQRVARSLRAIRPSPLKLYQAVIEGPYAKIRRRAFTRYDQNRLLVK